MKTKTLIAIVLMIVLGGCVRIKTKDMEYVRIGDQKINSLEIENPTLGKIKMGGQESNMPLYRLGPMGLEPVDVKFVPREGAGE